MYFKRLTGLSEILKFSATLILICSVLLSTNLLWRWDQLVYDAQQRLITRPAPNDIIIVAIDEASLSQLGRWPWRRNIHAELINRLSAEGAKIIAIDIIFAERDRERPDDDTKLVKAVKNSGNVVLPIIVEHAHKRSLLHETLPFPDLFEASAALGHVHVELDADGIGRSTYLKEGLGGPRWPSFSLAMLQLLKPDALKNLSGVTDSKKASAYRIQKWVREHHVKIPFYGPPGHFKTVSYQQVLRGQYPKNLFKGRIVYVGVTATGLGDSLPTPVSGLASAMPGVEVNANIFSGLREGIMIQNISTVGQYLVSLFLISIPVLLYPVLRPGLAFISTIILILSVLLMTVLLVRGVQVWYAPISALVTIAISYPIWSWRRLEYTMKYMDSELSMLDNQKGIVEKDHHINVIELFNFISSWLPITGCLVKNYDKKEVFSWGDGAIYDREDLEAGTWTRKNNYYCYLNDTGSGFEYCAFTWHGEDVPPEQLFKLVLDVVRNIGLNSAEQAKTTYEVIQNRIQEVHLATEKLRSLKQFIENSLNQIADAVLVIDCSGKVILKNERAKLYIDAVHEDNSDDVSIKKILEKINVGPEWNWEKIFSTVFLNDTEIQCQGNIGEQYSFLINVSLMNLLDKYEGYSFIISLTDISELKKSERKRNEALTFLSHDLRSPLVSILALTQLIENDKDNKTSNFNLKRIERHARNSIELAENFVQYSRTEGNNQILFEEINLIDVALNAIDHVWEQAQEKGIVIKKKFHSGTCYFNGNAQLMERVFINLLTNSIKYSDKSEPITVSINVNDSIRCIVEDHGIGIPENDLPEIMNHFKRSDNPRHQSIQGIGLGLAIVNVIIQKHGGKVLIESQVGKGTKIILDLPI